MSRTIFIIAASLVLAAILFLVVDQVSGDPQAAQGVLVAHLDEHRHNDPNWREAVANGATPPTPTLLVRLPDGSVLQVATSVTGYGQSRHGQRIRYRLIRGGLTGLPWSATHEIVADSSHPARAPLSQ